MYKILFSFVILSLYSCSNGSEPVNEKTQAALDFHQSIVEVNDLIGEKSKQLDQQLAQITIKAKEGKLDASTVSEFKQLIIDLSKDIDNCISRHEDIIEFDEEVGLKKVSLERLKSHKKLINDQYTVYLNLLVGQNLDIEGPEISKHLTNTFESLVLNNEKLYLAQKALAKKYEFQLAMNRDKEFDNYHQQIDLMKKRNIN